MRESKFQSGLIKKIKERFPGSMVLKNDPTHVQGIPDLTILFGKRWATLECKKDGKSHHQPNQDYYVKRMGEMSFSSFIYPENEEDVLSELERFFER